ncbi:hypothetical protein [Streptomyces nitrosporeus]|uniref:hypothetical protein n=1 Tax=Streptomyces nitrosporeus TaxID=28894 RepID=UPI0039A08F6A
MKALRLFQAHAPYDAVHASPSAAGILVPYRVPAGPAALVRPQTKALVRWLRHILHTGVYLATLRLPVGIVAWVYERRPRPRPRGRRPFTGGELVLPLLWVGAVIGGLVLIAVITAGEAATTPAGMPTGARDPLAAEAQSPFSVTNATAATSGAGPTSEGGRSEVLGKFRETTSFSEPSARSLYLAAST